MISAQAKTGKQGVLGPTKIYLAVHPAPGSQVENPQTQVSTGQTTTAVATVKQEPVAGQNSPNPAPGMFTRNLRI